MSRCYGHALRVQRVALGLATSPSVRSPEWSFDAWQRRAQSEYGGIPIWVIGREDLRRNKLASGRKQDLLDVEKLDER